MNVLVHMMTAVYVMVATLIKMTVVYVMVAMLIKIVLVYVLVIHG